MHKVRKLKQGEIYRTIKLSDTQTVVWQAMGGEFAIVDETDSVAFTPHPFTGKLTAQVFERKSAAQAQANYLNRQAD